MTGVNMRARLTLRSSECTAASKIGRGRSEELEAGKTAEKFAGSPPETAEIHDDDVDATSSNFCRRNAHRCVFDEQFMTCHELED